MRFSTRTEYGIRAMLDLAERAGQGPTQSHDVAARQDVPEPYLNQLFTLLRKAGLIVSRRGPGGGHILARPADEIDLATLVEVLEGPLWSPEVPPSGAGRGRRPAALQEVWDEVAEAAHRALARVTLAGLLERERRALSYQI